MGHRNQDGKNAGQMSLYSWGTRAQHLPLCGVCVSAVSKIFWIRNTSGSKSSVKKEFWVKKVWVKKKILVKKKTLRPEKIW